MLPPGVCIEKNSMRHDARAKTLMPTHWFDNYQLGRQRTLKREKYEPDADYINNAVMCSSQELACMSKCERDHRWVPTGSIVAGFVKVTHINKENTIMTFVISTMPVHI